jgi:hypothetical protein
VKIAAKSSQTARVEGACRGRTIVFVAMFMSAFIVILAIQSRIPAAFHRVSHCNLPGIQLKWRAATHEEQSI